MRPPRIWLALTSAFVFAAIVEAGCAVPATSPHGASLILGIDIQQCIVLCRSLSLIPTPEPPQDPDSPEPIKPPPVSPDTPESPENPKGPESPRTPREPRTPEAPAPPEPPQFA